MDNIIPDARTASDAIVAGNAGDTNVAFQKVVADAVNAAIASKTTSTTITFTGKAGADVMQVLQELRRKGWRVTPNQSGTSWTINC